MTVQAILAAGSMERAEMLRRSYTPFIILGMQRTGSTMLQMILHGHPEIKMYGELFNENQQKQFGFQKTFQVHPSSFANPARMLKSTVYSPEYPDGIGAAGFRLFYTHQKFLDRKGWNLLRRWRVHIIHLQRRNLLNQFLSYKLALRKWKGTPGYEAAYDAPILLDHAEFLEYISFMTEERRKKSEFFSRSPGLNIFYEDFTADPETYIQSILDFLGVSQIGLEIRTNKAKKKPNSEIISNYDEVKKAFILDIKSGLISPENLWWFDDEVSLS